MLMLMTEATHGLTVSCGQQTPELILQDIRAGGGAPLDSPFCSAVQGAMGKHRAVTPHVGSAVTMGMQAGAEWLPGWERAQGAQEAAVGKPLLPRKPIPAG